VSSPAEVEEVDDDALICWMSDSLSAVCTHLVRCTVGGPEVEGRNDTARMVGRRRCEMSKEIAKAEGPCVPPLFAHQSAGSPFHF